MTRITFLGTGTSNGIPQIGCHCPVCSSKDPKDKRYRSSLLIEKGSTKVIIDTGYEFRLQCLRAGVDQLDAVLYTHSHPDHLFGLDDLRVFCKNGKHFPIYSSAKILDQIQMKFPYAFVEKPNFGIPQMEKREVSPGVPFQIGELSFTPIPMKHYMVDSVGYRFGSVAYLTDLSDVRWEQNQEFLQGTRILIVDGLREREHQAHLNFAQAEALGRKIGAEKVWFTHLNHEHLHEEIRQKYGPYAQPAYDTLVLEVEE